MFRYRLRATTTALWTTLILLLLFATWPSGRVAAQNLLTAGRALVGDLELTRGGRPVVLTSNAGVPTDGTSGTEVKRAGPGSIIVDTTNKSIYVNTNTAASPTWTAAADERLIRIKEVALTNAQIKALRATAIELVAAPGAGKVVEFVSAVLLLDAGTNVLTESADNLVVRHENTTGTIVSQTIETTGFIDQSADTATNGLPKVDAIVAKSAGENKSLVLHNTGDGEIAGNAANDALLRVKVSYRVWATGW